MSADDVGSSGDQSREDGARSHPGDDGEPGSAGKEKSGTAHQAGKISEAIGRNLQNWLDYWSEITLHPNTYASKFKSSPSSSYKLYTLNIIIGLSVFIFMSCSYWSIYFPVPFREHFHNDFGGLVLFLTAGPAIVSAASAILIVFPSLLVWIIFRWTHGTGSLSGHVSRTLVCSNLEWLNAIFFAIAMLLNDHVKNPNLPQLSGNMQNLIFIVPISGVIAVRCYYSDPSVETSC
jgi:hypothetical protein